MKGKVDYEKAWEKLKSCLKKDRKLAKNTCYTLTLYDALKIVLDIMAKLEQCTEPQKKKRRDNEQDIHQHRSI